MRPIHHLWLYRPVWYPLLDRLIFFCLKKTQESVSLFSLSSYEAVTGFRSSLLILSAAFSVLFFCVLLVVVVWGFF